MVLIPDPEVVGNPENEYVILVYDTHKFPEHDMEVQMVLLLLAFLSYINLTQQYTI